MENYFEKTCGYCKHFRYIPDSDPDGVVIWGNCLADPEDSDEAFNVDDPACENWVKIDI